MRTLEAVEPGTTVRVTKIGGERSLRQRIMEMGITRGVEVYVRKVAPLGDPFEISVRGYDLSLRKNDAELIEVADIGGFEGRRSRRFERNKKRGKARWGRFSWRQRAATSSGTADDTSISSSNTSKGRTQQ